MTVERSLPTPEAEALLEFFEFARLPKGEEHTVDNGGIECRLRVARLLGHLGHLGHGLRPRLLALLGLQAADGPNGFRVARREYRKRRRAALAYRVQSARLEDLDRLADDLGQRDQARERPRPRGPLRGPQTIAAGRVMLALSGLVCAAVLAFLVGAMA